MSNRRYSIRGASGLSADTVTFDNDNYILEYINLGTVNEDIESAKYQLKSLYSTSSLSPRDIDIVGWCATKRYDTGNMPGYTTVDFYKRKLQVICAPMSEFTLAVEEQKTDGTTTSWYTVYTIKVRLAESIEWAYKYEDNNPFACKFAIHLTALDPFFYAKLYDFGTATQPNYYMLNPYYTDLTKSQHAFTYFRSSQYHHLYVNNFGHQPKYFIKGNISVTATCQMYALHFKKTNTSGTELGTNVNYYFNNMTINTSTKIHFDMDTMVLTVNNQSFYPNISNSRSLYFKPTETGYVDIYMASNSASTSFNSFNLELTSEPGFLEV